MFMFDIETLGVESTAVILSAAIIYFHPEDKPTYKDLLDNACFVKFDSKDQAKRLNRTIDLETLEWWKNQHEYVQGLALSSSKDDLKAEDGITIIHNYMNKYKDANKQTMWARGSLDQMAIDSLAVKVGMQKITGYNMWRDVRTAIDLMYGTTNGYCEVSHPEFRRESVIKHHPVHDCALDVMQLLYGVRNAN